MAQPSPVKVLEVCRVAPPPVSPDSTTPKSLPLTFFDMLLLKIPPTQRLYFYETSHPTTTFLEVVVPKLKHSLSLTLQHYVPLAGNVTWTPDYSKLIIEYVEGDTVSFTVAESEVDFYGLSGDNFREAQNFNPFLPCLVGSETRVPALALQVTLFPNVGFSIGYAVHHGVLDGKAITMFMHSWAFICTRGEDSTLIPELTPLYDRTMIVDPSDLETTYSNFWLEKDGPSNKSLALEDMKASPDAMLGTFLLTQDNIENIKMYELTGEYGISIAAKAIGEAIEGLKDGVLEGKGDVLSRYAAIPPGRFLSISGSPRFGLYKTDFGWGRPRKVETTSIDNNGAFSLSDSRDGSSWVEIGIVLNKHESEVFVSVFSKGLHKTSTHAYGENTSNLRRCLDSEFL
ncbi:hypothetical protein Acr_05g0006100 [Actinidia rufa]|uniref:HXXXD-type acyl-transferase family protein n=1 Tax=Actinidia rufa TaxID=165716 RepID=A0A7J0EKH1_9ERIC|nr:hypothetical protein Acr_05g0006100 [Actinidia rufa]